LGGVKKIGIAVDDYKLDKFKEELKQRGFNDFAVMPGVTKDTRMIRIQVEDEKFLEASEQIRRLCKKMEYHFKRSN
jgi:nitrogen regulatory protein PII